MKLSRRNIEHSWHTAAFILLMGAFVPLWRRMTLGDVNPGSGDPVQQLFLGIAYLGVVLLLYHPRSALRVARKGWLVWILIGWALLSILWSEAPDITLRRSLSAVLASLYGLLLAVRYRSEEVIRMLGIALAIVVTFSLLATVMNPDWAVMSGKHEGAWRGVFIHKNALGRIGALALIIFWLLALNSQRFARLFWYILIAMAILLVTRSDSASGLILILAYPLGWLFIKLLSSFSSTFRIAMASFLFGAFVLGLTILPDILEYLFITIGRDPTLTGRIPLWYFLLSFALARPFLGYGFSAFWLGEYGPSSIVWAVTWEAPHAHNGYLDLQLELGLVGVALGLAMVISLAIYSIHQLIRMPKSTFISATYFFSLFFIIANSSESVFLESGLNKSIYWVIFSYFLFARSSLLHKTDYYEF